MVVVEVGGVAETTVVDEWFEAGPTWCRLVSSSVARVARCWCGEACDPLPDRRGRRRSDDCQRPPPRSRSGRLLSMPSFALGLTLRAPAPHGTVPGRPSAGSSPRGGGTRGWQGKVGLAAHAASLAGLVAMHRARQAAAMLEEALVDGLGADYRSRISEPFTPRPEVPLTRRQLLAPDMQLRKRYLGPRRRLRRRRDAQPPRRLEAEPTCRPTPRRPCSSRSTAGPGWWA